MKATIQIFFVRFYAKKTSNIINIQIILFFLKHNVNNLMKAIARKNSLIEEI